MFRKSNAGPPPPELNQREAIERHVTRARAIADDFGVAFGAYQQREISEISELIAGRLFALEEVTSRLAEPWYSTNGEAARIRKIADDLAAIATCLAIRK